MANATPGTGASQLNASVTNSAANLAGPALQLASGAGLMRTASDTLKGVAIDKLLGPTALFAGGLLGVVHTMKAIVDQSGILERGMQRIANAQDIEGKFETLLKSAGAAKDRIAELYKFTSNSTFDFSDVAEANRTLEALTKGAFSGAKGMALVGDAAAATGQSMTDVADQVGKLYAALRNGRSVEKLTMQMQMTGVVTNDLVVQLEGLEQAGASFSDKWSAVTESLAASEGGMKAQMGTLDGLKAQLKNAGDMMEKAFGQPFVEAQTKSIQNTVEATKNLTPLLAQIGRDIQPIVGIKSNLANVITDATLATKGFADSLSVAWNLSKALFLGAAASSAASMAVSLKQAGQRGVTISRAVSAGRAAATAGGIVGVHETLQAGATSAFAKGDILAAGSLAAQAVWSRVSTTAMLAHSVALGVATSASGEFSFATYAAAMANQTLRGSLSLVGTALGSVGRGLAGLAMNPLTIAATAVSVATVTFINWAESVAAVNNEYVRLIQSIATATSGLTRQAAAVANLDQHRAAKASQDTALSKFVAESDKLGERPAPVTRSRVVGLTMRGGEQTGTPSVVTETDDSAGRAWDEKRTIIAVGLSKLQQARNVTDAKLGGVGLGRDERARVASDVDKGIQNRDATEQAAIDRADDPERLRLLKAKSGRLAKEILVGASNDAGRLSPERYHGAPTELMQLTTRIGTREKKSLPVDYRDYARQAELNKFADTHLDKIGQRTALRTEINTLQETLALKRTELDYDQQIAEIRTKGGKTAALEAAKELAVLEAQLRIAVAKGKAGEFDAAQTKAKIAALGGGQAEARVAFALGRAKDDAEIKRNPRVAQALQDNSDRAELRDRYKAAGRTEKQADSDFAAHISGQAAQTPLSIVADSLQSVGGGGGSFGSDPMLAAQQRLLSVTTENREYLRILADAARGDGGPKMR